MPFKEAKKKISCVTILSNITKNNAYLIYNTYIIDMGSPDKAKKYVSKIFSYIYFIIDNLLLKLFLNAYLFVFCKYVSVQILWLYNNKKLY